MSFSAWNSSVKAHLVTSCSEVLTEKSIKMSLNTRENQKSTLLLQPDLTKINIEW